jgi:hypothetical protein
VTSRIAAVGLILILALGLAACTGPTPGPEGADLVAAIEDLDGVVQVLPERDTEDDALLSLAVQTTLPGTDDLIDLGTAVADLVDTHDGPPTQLWRDEADDVAGVRVVLGTGTEPAGRLDQVRAFLSLAGVTGMQIQGEGDSVSVVAAADLVAVAETAQRLDVPLAMIATHAQRVTGYLPDGAFTPALARLAAQIDAWDGVTGMFLSVDGGLRVDVQVTGDDRVTAVADALTALDPPEGEEIAYSVGSSFRSLGGVVGRTASPADPAATGSTPGDVWPDDPGAPACGPGDLAITSTGLDAAAGHRYLTLVATSTADHPCAVEGTPAITFLRASGTPVPDVETGTPTGSPVGARQVLPVGGAVQAAVEWRAMSTAQDPDVTVSLRVTAVAGGPEVDVAVAADLDVLAGAAVQIGPWQKFSTAG